MILDLNKYQLQIIKDSLMLIIMHNNFFLNVSVKEFNSLQKEHAEKTLVQSLTAIINQITKIQNSIS
jgi:hypothetical protein